MKTSGLEIVFSRPAYILLAIVTAILFSAVYWQLTYYFSPLSFQMSSAMAGVYFLDPKTFQTLSLTLTFISSGMLGVNIAMLAHKFSGLRESPKKAGGTLLSGILGALASGCASCGAPILALFGFATGLALFPMQGLELKIIAVAVLAIATRSLSKSIAAACRVGK